MGPINPTEENQGLNEFHGPERKGNDMDWKIGPIRNSKFQYVEVTPI